jgi:hypothetical protein
MCGNWKTRIAAVVVWWISAALLLVIMELAATAPPTPVQLETTDLEILDVMDAAKLHQETIREHMKEMAPVCEGDVRCQIAIARDIEAFEVAQAHRP